MVAQNINNNKGSKETVPDNNKAGRCSLFGQMCNVTGSVTPDFLWPRSSRRSRRNDRRRSMVKSLRTLT